MSIKKHDRNKITDLDDNDSENEELNYEKDDEIIYVNLTKSEKLKKYKSNLIPKYIDNEKIYNFNEKSIICYYLWSGISELDKWELNRKIDKSHVETIYNEMKNDYKKKGTFYFYDHVHLAIKNDNIIYIMDGQHRLLACDKLYKKNKYPIQQIPCILWFIDNDDEFIEIFEKINLRTPLDKSKLFNYKIQDIINWMNENMGNNYPIWGKNRPKIHQIKFVEKMRENDSVYKLETNEIIKKINEINKNIRGLTRNKRSTKPINDSIHNNAETMDFFLGYDKELEWVKKI